MADENESYQFEELIDALKKYVELKRDDYTIVTSNHPYSEGFWTEPKEKAANLSHLDHVYSDKAIQKLIKKYKI